MTNPPNYPSRPVRLVTGAPGGSIDFATRLIAQGLTQSLGETVAVENLPAGAMAEVVSRAPPDGYTLLMTGKILWLTPFLRDNIPYDPMRDFAPITLAVSSPNVLVINPALPVQNLLELIAFAKANPGALKFTSSGSGSSTHLAGELFKVMAGADMVHVSYKGNVAAVAAVVAGDVQLMFSGTTAAQPHIRSGKLRALAVTSTQPSALFPGLPTVAESGVPGYQSTSILGMFAPARTPAPIIDRINQDAIRFLQMPDTRERLLSAGLESVGTAPEQLAATMQFEMTRLGRIIREAGIRA